MTSRERWNRTDWLILAGLLALVVLVWSRVLFSREWSFGVELDFIRQFYPARFFATESLAGGSFPLWNPYMLCGHPFFASYQTAMLYPINLAMVGSYAMVGADYSLKAQCAFVVIHFYLAGVFTYILAKDLKIGRAGSAVAAVTYMFCGFMVAHAGHMNQQSSAAWIPLIFLLFYRSLSRRRFSYSVAAGVAVGIALLAGHIQSVFYVCVLLLGLVALTALQRYRGDPQKTGLAYGVAALGTTVAVGAALAAAQLVPTYQLIGLSTRQEIPLEIARTGSLPPWQAVGLVFPHFFGMTTGEYVGGWLMWEMYGYAGIVGGALAVVALLRRRRGLVIFFWVAVLVSLILALGPGGYLFTVLYKAHLFFDRFHNPARTLVIFGFGVAILAGFGADHILEAYSLPDRREYRRALRLVAVLTVLVLLLVLVLSVFMMLRGPGRGEENRMGFMSMITPVLLILGLLLLLWVMGREKKERSAWLSFGLVTLVVIDLVALNTPWVMVQVNPDDIFGDAAASRYVAAQPGTFRVETDANNMYRALDDGAVYGLEKATGDDSLILADYDRYRELVVPSVSPGVQVGLFYEGGLTSELLDVMNDRYFLSEARIHRKLAKGKFEHQAYLEGVNVYRNVTAKPRAWMSDAVAFSDNEEVYQEMAETRGEGIRETALVVYPPAAGEEIPAEPGLVEVTSRSPHHLQLETDESCRGLLVTAEMQYPGWDVYVDGEKKEILRTNLIFRGVLLEGGQGTVEFRFHPRVLYVGIAVSLVAVAFLVLYFGGLLFFRRKKRRAIGDSIPGEATGRPE
ncbi:MAG: YfhO family protein [Actinobacteria bacterium]|nr:YfhO family protein [Actinomycetota bacterium]MCG2817450.1 YfhO family protein [Actinomycetes bacterium]MBU4179696.1 YfhO family protein [Actinomycetota bacterium]MBU4217933.1 YfhO family protein [Actinomycetota bacterium]MBU4360034.1 YfhO family protein [Actinomycetota bacterium]